MNEGNPDILITDMRCALPRAAFTDEQAAGSSQ